MMCKSILLAVIVAYIGYIILGIITTIVLRITNPLHKKCRTGKTLCLTFDDGMDFRYTPKLLDLLAEHHIHASFFILSSTAEKYPDILQRMKQEGHTVGLHSLNHHNQIIQLPHKLCMDFRKSMGIFSDLDTKPIYYRPPWGHVTPLGIWLCKRYHLKTVLWTVIIGDWSKNATVEILCHKLHEKVRGSAVICLHDGRGKDNAPFKTINTLKKMIPHWKKEGYTFETISEFIEENTD